MRVVPKWGSVVPDDRNIDVGGLAAVINSRLAAEARIARAISFGWIGGGTAIALCLTGLGCAAALYGYSYMISVKPVAEGVATALVQAIEYAELKTSVTGTMSLAENSEVHLAAGQSVKLEDGAIVKLEPNSSVRVVGDLKIDIPQPSKGQLQLDTTSKNDELPFTNYTVFTSVQYGTGEVVTGWNYDLSDTMRPKTQYAIMDNASIRDCPRDIHLLSITCRSVHRRWRSSHLISTEQLLTASGSRGFNHSRSGVRIRRSLAGADGRSRSRSPASPSGTRTVRRSPASISRRSRDDARRP
jgi:hypothetical protein